MNKWVNRSVIGCLIAAWGLGCAHSKLEQNLDEKLAKQPTLSGTGELSRQAKSELGSHSALTDEEKKALSDLEAKARHDLAMERDQSLKLRSLLIQDVAASSSDYNPDEVNLIKRRLKQIEDKRLSTIFSAVDEANRILGHRAAENQAVLRHMYEMDGHTGARFD